MASHPLNAVAIAQVAAAKMKIDHSNPPTLKPSTFNSMDG